MATPRAAPTTDVAITTAGEGTAAEEDPPAPTLASVDDEGEGTGAADRVRDVETSSTGGGVAQAAARASALTPAAAASAARKESRVGADALRVLAAMRPPAKSGSPAVSRAAGLPGHTRSLIPTTSEEPFVH